MKTYPILKILKFCQSWFRPFTAK